jgi:hypothetical protein
MPLRKPIVLIGADQYQIPAGDTLNAVALAIGAELVNNSASNQIICTPICPGIGAGSGGFQPARANAIGTSRVLGLISALQIGPGASGNCLQVGLLTASIAQWNAITSGNAGLIPGAEYFLSAVLAARLTTIPPDRSGDFVVRIGQALTPTLLFVNPHPPIGL